MDGVFRCQDEGFEVTSSNSSCQRLLLFVVSYFCDLLKGKDVYGARHRTTVDRPSIWGLVSRETFSIMNCAVNRSKAGKLIVHEENGMIIDRAAEIITAIYQIMGRSDRKKC